MAGEVEILPDGAQEVLLLAVTEGVVVGFVVETDGFVSFHEFAFGVECRVVEEEGLRLGVGIHIGALSRGGGLVGHNRDATLRADDVFHEEGDLAHHRSPAGLVPADGTVVEGDLELAVVESALGEFICQSGSDSGDADWFCPCHLTHDIHVMDTAIDDGGEGLHECLMGFPGGSGALLIEVHAHDQRFSEGPCDFDKANPAGVVAQNVADDEFAAGGFGFGNDAFGHGH